MSHIDYHVLFNEWKRITSDVTWTPGRANKVLGAGVKTSYVHSSIIKTMLNTIALSRYLTMSHKNPGQIH